MSELQEATKEFLIETAENLEQLDGDLITLEKSPGDDKAVTRIFRTLHTIKGSCAFLGLPKLQGIAHAGEDLLSKLRERELTLSSPIISGLLALVDTIRKILANIEGTGTEGNDEFQDLINRLRCLTAGKPVAEGKELEVTRQGASTTVSAQCSATAEFRPPAASDTPVAPIHPGEVEQSTGDGLSPSAYDSTVRISVELLDKIMNISSELVLSRNQILQHSGRIVDPAFQSSCRLLNLNTTELQEHVMKTRMQPISNVWQRFPRLVRDVCQAKGKKVRLDQAGNETELDRTLLEAIRDPLTHLVRNAIDHGIEPPERRRALGKPEEGYVRLRAYHEGGQVNVEISDDGGGIDPERVKQRALEQRLVTAEQANRMGPQSLVGLIFLPGFSTAASVTTLSGRGVGMDVVRTNVEKIGGSVDVQSVVGQGTTVRIRIPLTLAIIKVLVVTSAGDRYAIPQVSIVKLIRAEGAKARRAIQRIHDVLVYRYQDRLLPLVNLNQMLKLEPAIRKEGDAINIVVLQAADRQFGLVVDRINDTQEIVVKPLWKHLKSLACFAGATVMGDGKVALILDVFGLGQRAGAASDQQGWSDTITQLPGSPQAERPRVLLVESRDRSRKAIPLHQVARLEEFPRTLIERVADRPVVQYRGQILPLLDMEKILDSGPTTKALPSADIHEDKEAVQVVVCNRKEQSVGFIVERILDIADQDSDIRGPASRPGVLGTAVFLGHVTEMLDVESLVQASTGG
jgi:two-component system chemotaxis sensor kinase CheA